MRRVPTHLLGIAPNCSATFHFPAAHGERAWDRNIRPTDVIKCSLGTSNPRLYDERLLLARKQSDDLIALMEGHSPDLLPYQVGAYANSISIFFSHLSHTGRIPRNSFDVLELFYKKCAEAAYGRTDKLRNDHFRSFVGVLPFAGSQSFSEFLRMIEDFDHKELSIIHDYVSCSDNDFSREAILFRTEAATKWWLALNNINLRPGDRYLIMCALDAILSERIAITAEQSQDVLTSSAKAEPSTSGSLKDVYLKWEKERTYKRNTSRAWSSIIEKLDTFLKNKHVSLITRQDLIDWKDDLLDRGNLRPENVANNYLKAAKAILGFARRNNLIKENPLNESILKISSSTNKNIDPYKDKDVGFILQAATKYPLYNRNRWIAWLLATSGARVTEITQLHFNQIIQEEGIWALDIRPSTDGGTIKTKNSLRVVPIHKQLIADGFLDFVALRRGMPLFYRSKHVLPGQKHPSESVASTHGEWIRSLKGSNIDFTNKSPNHSLRHWFTTKHLEMDVKEGLTARIQGHKIAGERDTYVGRKMLEAMQKAIDRIEIVFE